MNGSNDTVSVVLTVLNDRPGCAAVLGAFAGQTRAPDEIVVVDGGSTDGTRELIERHAAADGRLRCVVAADSNIAQGRNAGIEQARGTVIVTTDAGCRAEPQWLERLVRPLEEDPGVDVVAGFYRMDPHSILETAVGLATMRGQLEPVDPDRFNPSARSMAFRKAVWRRAGGFPDWLYTSEDTLFDIKLRKMGVRWAFAGDAVVRWRPRSTMRSIGKQFYLYGRGRGHTQIEAADHLYHLRNLALLAAMLLAGLWHPAAWGLFAVTALYFLWWGLHGKAARVAARLKVRGGYWLALAVYWVVLFAGTAGYVVGSVQRWRCTGVYRDRMNEYLSTGGVQA